MKRLILAVIIILVLSGVFYSTASADFPPPPEDSSCCQNGWWELFYIPNSKYCNGGDYYIWYCKELGGKVENHDILYTSVCLSSIQADEIYTVYIPYIVKE